MFLCIYPQCGTPDVADAQKPTTAVTEYVCTKLWNAVVTEEASYQSTRKGSFGQVNCLLKQNNPKTPNTETLFYKPSTVIFIWICFF